MCSRVLIGLAQRGSVELDIKQKLLQAKEQAAKIIADAEFRSEVVETERLAPIEEREEKVAARRSAWRHEKNFLIPASATWTRRMLRCARANRRRCARRRSQKISQKERSSELAKAAHLSEEKAREELFRN